MQPANHTDAPTILVVDDTEAHRYVMSRILSNAGYGVLEATTGAEALAMLVQKPALAILDINLPDISGLELCRIIKHDPTARGILLLATSAELTTSDDKALGLDCGADVYLAQPFSSHELLATVGALLRLQRAEETLRTSNRELEKFARVAAHDLHEPLRMVTTYLQLLDKKNRAQLDEKSCRYLDFAVDGAQRLGVLVNDMVTYLRMEGQAISLETTDANRSLASALAHLADKIRDRGAFVTNDVLPSLLADPVRLVQLFQNLIANAITYCTQTPPTVNIAVEDHAHEWVFSITDNGIGIASEHLQRIFEMFERLHPRSEYPGTGLGLTVCKRIVEHHDGRIWARSTPGQGSTFFFSLAKHPSGHAASPIDVAGVVPA